MAERNPPDPGDLPADEEVRRYRRARKIFDQVCPLDPSRWKEEVSALSGGDSKLEEHVLLLLTALEEDPGFLEMPRQIGPYRVLERIGEGGMGIVYRARQESPRREVALKVLTLRSAELRHRFQFEQQVLALMNHPNIAQVYQTGVTSADWPYLAMELVEGLPLTEYCDRHELSVAERLKLLIAICQGVEHAHRRGIIHRDLKPSNILVRDREGEPNPVIIDFGIAKAVAETAGEQTTRTRFGQRLGTPAYMAPEQRCGAPVDTRADIYALGVMLYEVLTGTLPRDSDEDGSQQLAVASPPPVRPSARVLERIRCDAVDATAGRRLVRELRGDIDEITVKALQSDPEWRYDSARDLARDLRRHLANEPVLAHGPGRLYTMAKFLRRHRRGAVAAAALAIVGAMGGAAAFQAWRTRVDLQREVDLVERIAESVVAMAGETSPRQTRGARIDPRDLLDRASRDVLDQVRVHPAIEFRLRVRIGDAYRRLGYYEEAEEQLQRAVELTEQVFDGPTREEVDALNALGNVYNLDNEYARAATWYERARDMAAAVDSSGELEAAILKNLADCYARLDRVDEAISLLEEAIALRERAPDAESYETREGIVVTLTSIGDMERRKGRLEDAFETLTEALELRKQIMDPEDPKLAFGYFARAQALLDAERFTPAREDFEKAAAIWRGALRPDHPTVAACAERLGRAYWGEGDQAEADAHFREALAIEETIAGDDPVHVIEVLETYVEFLQDTGRAEDAAREGARLERLRSRAPGSAPGS